MRDKFIALKDHQKTPFVDARRISFTDHMFGRRTIFGVITHVFSSIFLFRSEQIGLKYLIAPCDNMHFLLVICKSTLLHHSHNLDDSAPWFLFKTLLNYLFGSRVLINLAGTLATTASTSSSLHVTFLSRQSMATTGMRDKVIALKDQQKTPSVDAKRVSFPDHTFGCRTIFGVKINFSAASSCFVQNGLVCNN